jgi:UDP-glucose 4-epimerase
MVEYSSPNTNKPLHLGHLRNNFLGWSIAEVVEHFEDVLGRKVKVSYGPRRDGDPAKLVANGSKFQQEFKWYPTHSRLDGIIATAWAWYNSDRYKGAV